MPRPRTEGERRSENLQTLVTPTTKRRMEKILTEGDSVSNLLNDLLRDYLDECGVR